MTPLEAALEGSRKSPRYKQLAVSCARRFIAFAGEHPDGWTTAAVEAWRDQLIDEGLKAASVNTYVNALKFVSRRYARVLGGPDFAVDAETVSLLSDTPQLSGNKREALTQAECKRLLATCENSARGIRDRAMILVMLHCAFRRQEICDLHMEYVEPIPDGSSAILSVVVKGRRWHSVEVGGEAWRALRAWITYLIEHGVSAGPVFRRLRPSVRAEGWIVDSGLSGDGVYKLLRQRAEDARVKDFHPHRMRHTFVTLAREAGWEDWQIRKVTGHKYSTAGNSPMVDRYSHDRAGPLGARFPALGESDD